MGVVFTISGAMAVNVYVSNDGQSASDAIQWADGNLAARFRDHTARWKTERRASPSSKTRDMFASPHYLRIIGMGRPALPLILAELQARPDHWDCALEMITEENPVPAESAGKMKEIARAWIDWGRARQII